MNFNNHSNLEGQHAFLGASKYHWINYGEDKVAEAYRNFLATQKGTVLHAFAAQCIMLNQKLPKSKQTLNMYVNDALKNPLNHGSIKTKTDNLGRPSQQFIGKSATVAVNPENGTITTTWCTGSRTKRKYLKKGRAYVQ